MSKHKPGCKAWVCLCGHPKSAHSEGPQPCTHFEHDEDLCNCDRITVNGDFVTVPGDTEVDPLEQA